MGKVGISNKQSQKGQRKQKAKIKPKIIKGHKKKSPVSSGRLVQKQKSKRNQTKSKSKRQNIQVVKNKLREKFQQTFKQYKSKGLCLYTQKIISHNKKGKQRSYNLKKKNWYVRPEQSEQIVDRFQSKEFRNHQKALNKKICRIFLEHFFPKKACRKSLTKSTNRIYYLMNVVIVLVVEHKKNKSNVSQIRNMLKTIGQITYSLENNIIIQLISYFVKKINKQGRKKISQQQISKLIEEVPWRIDTIKICAKILLRKLNYDNDDDDDDDYDDNDDDDDNKDNKDNHENDENGYSQDYQKNKFTNFIRDFCSKYHQLFTKKKRSQFFKLLQQKVKEYQTPVPQVFQVWAVQDNKELHQHGNQDIMGEQLETVGSYLNLSSYNGQFNGIGSSQLRISYVYLEDI